jgi:malonate decarboxylase beta subunit
MMPRAVSYFEASARARVTSLVDAGSFTEFCPPGLRHTSPHLAKLDAPVAFDDGVVVGKATIGTRSILIAAQEGRFNGGAVGEVHGAKIRGLLERARHERPDAVLLLIDSGGVRLHEANAGLIAISEIMRALLAAQAAGVPVIALVGGSCGAFGGMGIVTRLCDAVIMSEEGRLGLSGPEVIETVKGVEEFDARDRSLVWRVTGGKLRRALGEATLLVNDDLADFRIAALRCVTEHSRAGTELEDLQADQSRLEARRQQFPDARDGLEVWREIGLQQPAEVSMLSTDAFNRELADAMGERA